MTTWVDGTVVTAAQLNAQLRDLGNFLLDKPLCLVYNNAGVVTTTGTAALIPWDTEVEDDDGMHSTVSNTSRIVCQTPGVYSLWNSVRWPSNATGIRTINLRLNAAGASGGGTSLYTGNWPPTNGGITFTERTILFRYANIGDYTELFGTQTSGGGLTTDSGLRVTCAGAEWITT